MGNKGRWNDEPVIKQKSYTKEEYAKKKARSYKIAKSSCYLCQVMGISGWNAMVSFLIFIVMLIVTSVLPDVMGIKVSYEPETFWCRGGIIMNICVVFLEVFGFSGIGYAVSYKIVEIMCIHLDGGLEGAMEVDDAAMKGNLKGQIAENVGGAYVETKAIVGPMAVLTYYCMQNDVHMIDTRFFNWINRVLVVSQCILACVCVYVLI